MEYTLCKDAGKRIKYIRKARGYTRDGLAEKAAISSKFLYEIELGKKRFSAEVLCHIAKALGVSCDYIMFGEAIEKGEENGMTETLALFDEQQQQRLIPLLKQIHELMN